LRQLYSEAILKNEARQSMIIHLISFFKRPCHFSVAAHMSKADDLFMDSLGKETLSKQRITGSVLTYIFSNNSTALFEKRA
jgi:hypothetical protein